MHIFHQRLEEQGKQLLMNQKHKHKHKHKLVEQVVVVKKQKSVISLTGQEERLVEFVDSQEETQRFLL